MLVKDGGESSMTSPRRRRLLAVPADEQEYRKHVKLDDWKRLPYSL